MIISILDEHLTQKKDKIVHELSSYYLNGDKNANNENMYSI